MLSITQASKSYNNVPALIDVSFDIQSGDVHALIGENGAGKSTLIKILAGVLPADSIQILLRGTPVTIHNPQIAYDLGLRFIHQELNVVPQLSVAENIFLGQPGGLFVNWRKLNADTQAILRQFGITHIQPQTIMARLSFGDQMLVKIASAFLGNERSNASIYIMDEPTAALSGAETATLFRMIRQMCERGCAVLYVSHRIEEIFQIANRVSVLRDGRLVATKAINETSPADVIQLMTGRAMQQIYPPRQAPIGENILLDVRNLRTKSVRAVTFELWRGEILGVAGLIGSGRTELIRALMGIDRLITGSITLEGKPLNRYSLGAAWQQGIAYVPEERRSQGLILSRSVGNNITLPHLGRFSRGGVFLNYAREQRLSTELGAQVRLKMRSSQQTVRELSGGNQQKVVFARALAYTHHVLLLDEPTRGVDVGAKYEIYTLIRQVGAEGIGILIVSSDLAELIGLCDRILVMRQGQLSAIVPAASLTEGELLSLSYGEAS